MPKYFVIPYDSPWNGKPLHPQRLDCLFIIKDSLCEESNRVRRRSSLSHRQQSSRSCCLRGMTQAAVLDGWIGGLNVMISPVQQETEKLEVQQEKSWEVIILREMPWWVLRERNNGEMQLAASVSPARVCSRFYSHKSPPNQIKLPVLRAKTPYCQV